MMDSKNSATGNIEDDKELLAKARKALLQNQDDPSKIKSAKIVKFIFENVYQGIKDDLSEDDSEMERILMKRLKVWCNFSLFFISFYLFIFSQS